MKQNPQLHEWTGAFGREYLARNAAVVPGDIERRADQLGSMLSACPEPPNSILEVGANVGKNLMALHRISAAALYAVEPFAEAYRLLTSNPDLPLAGSAQCSGDALPFEEDSMDFTFTSGVLIHVPPEGLAGVVDELVRVSRRYLWCNEYFSKQPETVTYRGEQDLLFKRDFGRFILERHPGLRVLATGFFWSVIGPYDDTTWWLFQKR